MVIKLTTTTTTKILQLCFLDDNLESTAIYYNNTITLD